MGRGLPRPLHIDAQVEEAIEREQQIEVDHDAHDDHDNACADLDFPGVRLQPL